MVAPSTVGRDQSGFTLIEMLVGMTIAIVVLAAALGLTESGARSSSRTTDRVEVMQRSRLAMERLVRTLRSQVCLDSTTPPIISGAGDSIDFYTGDPSTTDYRPQRRRITFSTASGGSIVEQIYHTSSTAAPWSFPSSATRTTTIAMDLGQLGGAPFLRYYGYNASSPLTVPLNTSTTAPLATNSIARVVRVDVAFQVAPTNGNAEARRRSGLEAAVYARNTESSGGSAQSTDSWGPRCD